MAVTTNVLDLNRTPTVTVENTSTIISDAIQIPINHSFLPIYKDFESEETSFTSVYFGLERDENEAAPRSLIGSEDLEDQDHTEDLLKILEKSFSTFEEDLLSGCLGEEDVEKLLQSQREEMNQKMLRFFFLCFILFFLSMALSIYAVIQSRKNNLGRHLSRKAVFRYKKSFVNESDTTHSESGANPENDSAFQIENCSLKSNTLRCRNNSNQTYNVSV